MKYTNPVIRGFYPDPSICSANGKYYLVCSSFQYFPGVPVFESKNLVNWHPIGHVLTRPSQVMLENVRSSGGVFAPTIRYHNGRFYMVTNNNSTQRNFYVYTDDIYGAWSEPVEVSQNGIDPSLYFEGEHCYFISNGTDDNAEEGGTEYGHMITYARSRSVWGPFENYPGNPVLTNRDKAPYSIQGIGHGDLIRDFSGNWHVVSLGFRQIALWEAYHTLGREVFLTPVQFQEDGWFTAGTDGTTADCYEMDGTFSQDELPVYSFATPNLSREWCFLRHPQKQNYHFSKDSLTLHGTAVTLEETASPTFVGLRQRDFSFTMYADISLDQGEGGITVYSCENEHYDIAICKNGNQYAAVLKLNIGGIKHIQQTVPLSCGQARLCITADPMKYHFYIITENMEIPLGDGVSKYLSSEVSGGFTGVILGFYAIGDSTVRISDFNITYTGK